MLIFEIKSLICEVALNSKTLIVERVIAKLSDVDLSMNETYIVSLIITLAKRSMIMNIIKITYVIAIVLKSLLNDVFTNRVS